MLSVMAGTEGGEIEINRKSNYLDICFKNILGDISITPSKNM